MLNEGGNVFPDVTDIPREYVKGVVQQVRREIPSGVEAHADIGSAGYKISSGDMDLFIDADQLMTKMGAKDEKTVKQLLSKYMQAKGYETSIKGRNVHVRVPYETPDGVRYVQVDLMVIRDAGRVADWHQHGPRGMYDQPGFKASDLFILLNSIGKPLGLKIDAFAGNVIKRDNNEVVATNRAEAAKILLSPNAKASDLNSVATVLAALRNDPMKDEKLAQARQDAAKGLITLPESRVGHSQWFREWSERLK